MITESLVKEVLESTVWDILGRQVKRFELESFWRGLQASFISASVSMAKSGGKEPTILHSPTGSLNFNELMRSIIMVHLWASSGLDTRVCSKTLDSINDLIAHSFKTDSNVQIETIGTFERATVGYVFRLEGSLLKQAVF